MLEGSEKQLTNWQVWVLAARPKTLPAAAAPVLVGSAAALVGGGFHLGVFCAALLAALLLQVGANLANDVFDFHKGADAHQRLGPTRVTQAGLLLPEQVYRGMWLVFGVASLLGLYLIWMAGWPILVIGVASILAAIAYTGGPFPFGYYGLGEFFVFLFFGLAAVCGTYYAHLHSLDILAIVSSLPMGFLITAILVVNNLRDIETDRLAGKRTLAVRLKVPGTRVEFLLFDYCSIHDEPCDVADQSLNGVDYAFVVIAAFSDFDDPDDLEGVGPSIKFSSGGYWTIDVDLCCFVFPWFNHPAILRRAAISRLDVANINDLGSSSSPVCNVLAGSLPWT